MSNPAKELEKSKYEDLRLCVDQDVFKDKRTLDFAASLCEWYETKGFFTPKQFEKVEELLQE